MGETTRECMLNHCGLWLCEPGWLSRAVGLVKAGVYPMVEAVGPTPRERLYEVDADGTATIPIVGPMFKGGSKFASVSTVDVKRAVRLARLDPAVSSIYLSIDSPGGHVAGVQALADEVREAGRVKPVHAHLEDMGASAAYWVASQARRVTANATAEVGSVGVVAVVEDTSKAAEMAGVEVHVVASGPQKADLAPGRPVTPDALAVLQEQVDALAQHFYAAVKAGRRVRSEGRWGEIQTGRVWIAEQALGLGLIDAVESEEAAREAAGAAGKAVTGARRARAGVEAARVEAGLLEARRALAREIVQRIQRGRGGPY